MYCVRDAIVVTDLQHNIIYFNDRAATISPHHSHTRMCEGDDYRRHISSDNIAAYKSAWQKVMLGATIRAEQQLVVNGRKVWCRLGMSPVYNSSNGIIGITIIVTDIEEQKSRQHVLEASEQRFRSAFEHSSIGMAIVAPDGRWLRVNDTLCKIVGYTHEEMLGMTAANITHPDDQAESVRLIATITEQHADHYSMELRLLHKTGSHEWISGVVSAIRDRKGALSYYVWQLRHVAERRQMIDRLRASENLLNLFVEHSPAAIAMFDRNMCYLQVSRRWMRDFGLGDETLVGRSHYDVFPGMKQEWKDIHARCMTGVSERREEDTFIRQDGQQEWGRWEIHPWYNAAGEVGGIIMMSELITDRKRMELERESMLEALLSRNRDLSSFASLVSHNLRGPLATILGLCDLLNQDIPEVQKDTIIAGVKECATRLDAVVKEMNMLLNATQRK